MKQPKFFALLQTLSADSLQRFQRYLQFRSPRSNQYLPILDFLSKIHPQYDLYKGDLKAEIEKILLANEAKLMNNKRRGNFLYRLNEELNDFLAIEQLKTEPHTQHFLIINALRNHGAVKAYNDAIESAFSTLGKQTLSPEQNLAQLKLHHEAYYNTLNNKFLDSAQGIHILQAAQQQLDLFYRKQQLKYQIEFLNWQKIIRRDTPPTYQEPSASLEELLDQDTLFQLYQQVHELQKDEHNVEKYQHLVQLYRKHLLELAPEDQAILLRYLNNAAANLLRGDYSLETLRFSFDLADLAWQHQLLDALGGYTPTNFMNYVEIAVSLQELKWLARFIEENIKRVPQTQREEIHTLALANYCYGSKDYDTALKHLLELKSQDILGEFRIRMLYCKIFYTLGETETLQFRINAFDTYLRRSPMFKENIVRAYLNFLKLLRLLLDGQQHDKLKKLLPTTTPLYGRMWLEQQLLTKR